LPSIFYSEVPTTIPVAISPNHTQNTSWSSYSVRVQWHTDTCIADMIKHNSVVSSDTKAWNIRLQELRDQWSKPKQFKLHDTRELSSQVDLEQAVTQYIQDICTELSTSHEAVVAQIHVQGPVHIPSDFTIIEMPTLDMMPQYRLNAVTSAIASANATSALLYVTTQRPDAAAMSSLVSSTTLAAPVPIARAYCPFENTVDNDLQAVQAAMYTAVDTLIRESTVHLEYDRANLSACISSTVLVSRRAIGTDGTACEKIFEQIRYVAIKDKLVQWSTLLDRFSVLACGIKSITVSTAAATACSETASTIDKLQSTTDALSAAIQPFCEGMRDIFKRAVAESILQKEMNRGDHALSVSLNYTIDWITTAGEVLLRKFAQQCALAYSSSVLSSHSVSTDSSSSSNDSAIDKVKKYLTAYAKTEVRFYNFKLLKYIIESILHNCSLASVVILPQCSVHCCHALQYCSYGKLAVMLTRSYMHMLLILLYLSICQ
jgi:hypothetical protein